MHACMYVCMYVRMYVCMYVCMYVSTHPNFHIGIYVKVYSCTRIQMCLDMCIYAKIHMHTYTRMYVHERSTCNKWYLTIPTGSTRKARRLGPRCLNVLNPGLFRATLVQPTALVIYSETKLSATAPYAELQTVLRRGMFLTSAFLVI